MAFYVPMPFLQREKSISNDKFSLSAAQKQASRILALGGVQSTSTTTLSSNGDFDDEESRSACSRSLFDDEDEACESGRGSHDDSNAVCYSDLFWRPPKGSLSPVSLIKPQTAFGGSLGDLKSDTHLSVQDQETFLADSQAFDTLGGGDWEAAINLISSSAPKNECSRTTLYSSTSTPRSTSISVTELCELRVVARWVRRNGFDKSELRRPNWEGVTPIVRAYNEAKDHKCAFERLQSAAANPLLKAGERRSAAAELGVTKNGDACLTVLRVLHSRGLLEGGGEFNNEANCKASRTHSTSISTSTPRSNALPPWPSSSSSLALLSSLCSLSPQEVLDAHALLGLPSQKRNKKSPKSNKARPRYTNRLSRTKTPLTGSMLGGPSSVTPSGVADLTEFIFSDDLSGIKDAGCGLLSCNLDASSDVTFGTSSGAKKRKAGSCDQFYDGGTGIDLESSESIQLPSFGAKNNSSSKKPQKKKRGTPNTNRCQFFRRQKGAIFKNEVAQDIDSNWECRPDKDAGEGGYSLLGGLHKAGKKVYKNMTTLPVSSLVPFAPSPSPSPPDRRGSVVVRAPSCLGRRWN